METPSPKKNPRGPRLLDKIRSRIFPGAPFCKSSYSQSGEDLVVKFIFDAIGVAQPSYLDIGAFHPFLFSNTAIFYEAGCRGINVEPNPENFSLFQKHRPHDVNLNIGIAPEPGKLDYFLLSAPTMNTFSEKEAMALVNSGNYSLKKKIPVEVQTLQEVLKEHFNGHFPDFLTLDVEGFDDAIIRSIEFEKAAPAVICLETISYSEDGKGLKNDELIRFLVEKNYLVYADTYINTIFVQRTKWLRS